MKRVWRDHFSLFSQGVHRKFLVAAGLMSLIPLLVLLYIVGTYVTPHARFSWPIVAVVVIAGIITVLGYIVARDVILPIAAISKKAKTLATGAAIDQELPVNRSDELGELSESMNRLNQRIIGHMKQLKDYGEQVRQLNTEVHKRVLAFSNLLQVSNLISQGVALDEVLSCVMEKLWQIEEADLYALLVPTDEGEQFTLQVAHGANPQQISLLRGSALASPWLTQLARESQMPLVVDGRHRVATESRELQRLFGLTNALLVPVISRGRCLALLVAGNRRPQFVFSEDVVETTKVFAKQVAIAVENDRLTKRAMALAVTDELTGLYNDGYLRVRLEEEVKRAGVYHHPCSLVVLILDDFGRAQREYGTLATELILKQVAQLMLGQISPVDKIARLRGNEFGVILPERTKREAIELAEVIRQRIASSVFTIDHSAQPMTVTMSGGVSENPLDGATAEQLLTKALDAARAATGQGKNRIVAC